MTKYKKISRWIKIKYIYVTNRHSLSDYAELDEENNKLLLCCFSHKGKLYAIGQFMRLPYPIMFDDTDGKLNVIGGCDATSYYNPYLLEIDDNGEYVRLWQEYEIEEKEE